jgi:hypothetical protein
VVCCNLQQDLLDVQLQLSHLLPGRCQVFMRTSHRCCIGLQM